MQESLFKPKRILVPTDFSLSAERAIGAAAALAKEFGSSIYLLHIIPMFPIAEESGYSSYFSQDKYLEESRRTVEGKLLHRLNDLQAAGIEAAYGIEVGNDVVGNMMMAISKQQSNLVVISTHGVSGWRPIVFGSIAEQVIKLVECPLLLLRTEKPSA